MSNKIVADLVSLFVEFERVDPRDEHAVTLAESINALCEGVPAAERYELVREACRLASETLETLEG